MRSTAILGSASIDMTQMVNLAALDRVSAANEYWLPDAPDKAALPGDWQALQFLSSRSTYYINAFFEFVEQANENAIHQGPEGFLQLLLNRSKALRGNKMGIGAAYVVEKLDQYAGFAGVPLASEDHLAIVSRLSQDVTGTVLPAAVLDNFRIGTSDVAPVITEEN